MPKSRQVFKTNYPDSGNNNQRFWLDDKEILDVVEFSVSKGFDTFQRITVTFYADTDIQSKAFN